MSRSDVVARLFAALGDRVDVDPGELDAARADKSGQAAAGTPLAIVHAASVDDVRAMARPVLRHRVLPNFHAESEGLTSVKLVEQLLEAVKP